MKHLFSCNLCTIFSEFFCFDDVLSYFENREKYVTKCKEEGFDRALKHCNEYLLLDTDVIIIICSHLTFFLLPFFQQENSSANAFDRKSIQSDSQLDSTACHEKKVDVQKLNDKCDKCSVLTEKCDALNAEIAKLKEALQNLQMKESSNEEEIEDKYYEVESIIAHENRGRSTTDNCIF